MKFDMNNEKDQRFAIACIVIFILLAIIGGNIYVRYYIHQRAEEGYKIGNSMTGEYYEDNWPN